MRNNIEYTSPDNGRKYLVLADDEGGEQLRIVIGPPDGLVDSMGLVEPWATRLHNILFERRIFSYQALSAKGMAQAILQEFLSVDTQKLSEAFFNFEKETV